MTVRVDGLAASAASIVAMAGDEIIMGPGTQLMIHDPWVYTQGDAAFLRSEADRLEKTAESMASLYARRAGGTADEWRDLMTEETWFTAEEAVEAGLADRVDSDDAAPVENNIAATFNLAHFRYAGRAHAPAPRIPSAEAVEGTQGKEGVMPTFMESLRTRLGVTEDASEDDVLAALDAALAARTEGQSIEARADVVAVDRSRFAEMQSQLAELAAYRQQQEQAAAESYLAQAMADGKFPPAKLSHYRDLLNAAPEQTRALIDGMPKNVIPVAEIGHDGDGVHVDELTAQLNAAADKSGVFQLRGL